MSSTKPSLLYESQAWSFVLEWARDKIQFPQLVELMTRNFGDRYIPAEWQDLFNRVFLCSDPGEDIEDVDRGPMAIAAVEEAVASLGVAIDSVGPSADQPHGEGKGKRKATPIPRHPRPKKRTCTTSVNRFLDVEAQVDTEDEDLPEVEDSQQFIVADDAGDAQAGRPAIPSTRVYPLANQAGPSSFRTTVDKIARRFMPSSFDDLNDTEFNRLHDEYHGIPQNEGEETEHDDEEEFDDSNMKVLDAPGIWGAIQEWLYGTLNYPTLLEMIDFQYDHNPKMQYWEELLSRLAFIHDLDERKTLFRSISLADHLVRIANYQPPAVSLPDVSQPSPSAALASSTAEAKGYVRIYVVNVAPYSSVDYIVNAWRNASIQSQTHKLLPGRVTVRAAYPNVFLHAVSPSHRSCIRGWSLIPPEDQIWHSEGSTPSVPGWYSVSKRGIYKGDLGYAVSFDSESAELHVLVVPRRLKWRSGPPSYKQNVRTLFSPNIHHGQLCPPYRGLPCYKHFTNVFIAGLLSVRLKAHQFMPVSAPSPSQITLHIASMVNPQFMNATHERYNRLFWKPGDRITISDTSLGDTWGSLVSIDFENECAVVGLPGGLEYDLPLSSLSRRHRVGDVVRVLADPSSDAGYVHHQNLGRSGMICDVDPLLGDITVQDSLDSQFRVPGYLLESHIPDQPVHAPFGVLAPSVSENYEDAVQVGDVVELRDGNKSGYVIEVRGVDGTLTFISRWPGEADEQFEVPISAVRFTPDHRALRFTPDRGYDVKPGDSVVVVRGDHRGSSGTVSQVSLEQKSLIILCHPDQVSITVPIIHCARAYTRDEDSLHRDKEVLIISGPNKGWRGCLVSCGADSCVVARNGGILETYKKDQVVVRGLASTLAGRRLSPLEVLQVSNAFTRAIIRNTPERALTPVPDPDPQPVSVHTASPNPWTIDDGEREELVIDSGRPKLTVHKFMLHPNVAKSLETVQAVFQIVPGWRDTYTGRLAKTEVPDPFETASGPVPTGHLACRLTSRTKGAQLLQEIIPETSLRVYQPVKKNTLCMVIKDVHGGEPSGSVLIVVKASAKEQRVYVQRLDGTPAREASLLFDRVIVVEAPI